ncbi:MAG: AraC family transcriptional regulator [Acidobacteriota bacterium]
MQELRYKPGLTRTRQLSIDFLPICLSGLAMGGLSADNPSMRTEMIRRLVARHAPTDGAHDTPLEGIQLFRLTHPVERLPAVYSPSVCVVVQGSKRAYLGEAVHVYSPGQYLCATMPMPVQAEASAASPEKPLLGLLVSLETRAFTETVVEFETASVPLPQGRSVEMVPGLAVVRWDNAFSSALQRMLELLEDPLALRVLGPGRLREFFFAILLGEAGSSIRRTFGSSHGLSRAMSYLRENLDKSLSVNDLAQRAGMSRAVFDRRFREATTLSPLQFIKKLRLNEAAMQIAQGVHIGQAAGSVGYSSFSQFSREFRHHYGEAPRAWGKLARTRTTDTELSAL